MQALFRWEQGKEAYEDFALVTGSYILVGPRGEDRPWPNPPELCGDRSQCAQLLHLPGASTLACSGICAITLGNETSCSEHIGSPWSGIYLLSSY